MTKKNYANLHYPGMNPGTRLDPQENLSPEILSFYEKQVLTIGEKNQRKLFCSSLILLDTSPLATRVVSRLWDFGLGRVGVFGDNESNGSSLLKSLSALKNQKYPFLEFEPFRNESIDRTLEDIIRGFEFIVCSKETHQSEPRIKEAGLKTIVFDLEKSEATVQLIGGEKKSIHEQDAEKLLDHTASVISQVVFDVVQS